MLVSIASPVSAGARRAMAVLLCPLFAFVLFTVVLKLQSGKQNRGLMRIVPPRRCSSGQIKDSKSLVL